MYCPYCGSWFIVVGGGFQRIYSCLMCGTVFESFVGEP